MLPGRAGGRSSPSRDSEPRVRRRRSRSASSKPRSELQSGPQGRVVAEPLQHRVHGLPMVGKQLHRGGTGLEAEHQALRFAESSLGHQVDRVAERARQGRRRLGFRARWQGSRDAAGCVVGGGGRVVRCRPPQVDEGCRDADRGRRQDLLRPRRRRPVRMRLAASGHPTFTIPRPRPGLLSADKVGAPVAAKAAMRPRGHG